MISMEELRKLKGENKLIVLDVNRNTQHFYLTKTLNILGDKAMTSKELSLALGYKKTSSKLRYYEKKGYLKAIIVPNKKEIHYIKS